jgi:hypothetical protein
MIIDDSLNSLAYPRKRVSIYMMLVDNDNDYDKIIKNMIKESLLWLLRYLV